MPQTDKKIRENKNVFLSWQFIYFLFWCCNLWAISICPQPDYFYLVSVFEFNMAHMGFEFALIISVFESGILMVFDHLETSAGGKLKWDLLSLRHSFKQNHRYLQLTPYSSVQTYLYIIPGLKFSWKIFPSGRTAMRKKDYGSKISEEKYVQLKFPVTKMYLAVMRKKIIRRTKNTDKYF